VRAGEGVPAPVWQERMRVLGIDCGTERTGYGIVETDGRRHSLVVCGVIRTSPRKPLEARLVQIAAGLRDLIRTYEPADAAVEAVFYSTNVKTALKLAHVRGVALMTVAESGLGLGEYSPAEVKGSVVGYGRAEKHQVQMMVQSLLRLNDRIESEDAADALAVAICHAVRAGVARTLEGMKTCS
jgi:crossover junction endodeoxyribonuclease RuvC